MSILEAFIGFLVVFNFVVVFLDCQIVAGERSSVDETDSFETNRSEYEGNILNLREKRNVYYTTTVLIDYNTHNMQGFTLRKSDGNNNDQTALAISSTVPYTLNTRSTMKNTLNDSLSRSSSTSKSIMERKLETISIVPTKTLLNSLILQDQCAEFGTCTAISNIKFKYCQCDDNCHIYNDCCRDRAVLDAFSSRQLECRPFSSLSSHEFQGAFMISTCPSTFIGQDIAELCLNEDIMAIGPPVFGIDSFVYKNKFCAICNDIFNYQFFNTQFFTIGDLGFDSLSNKTQREKMSFLLKKQIVRYKFVASQENMYFRRCLITQSPQNESLACQQYPLNPVLTINGEPGIAPVIIFRNVFCVAPNILLQMCIGPYIDQLLEDAIRGEIYDMQPLSIIFKFDEDVAQSDTCIQKTNGVCDSEESYYNYTFSFRLEMKYDNSLASKYIKQIWLSIAWSLSVASETKLISFRAFSCNTSCYIDVSIRVLDEKNMQELLTFKNYINSLKWNAKLLDELTGNSTNVNAQVAQETVPTGQEIGLVLDESDMNVLNIENFFKKENIRISTNVTKEFCNDFLLFAEVKKNESAIFIIKNFQCFVFTLIPQTNIEVRTVTSYVCISLSEIALIFSIVLSRKIGLTKSVAGSNTENLSISLALANLLFLLGVGANDIRVVCYVIGIILHYLWLTVFVFMSVAVVYIGYHLRKITITQTSKKSVQMQKIYMKIVGLVVPVFIVVPSVVLDYLNVSSFKATYGGRICFPTSYPANLIFFSGPIILCIVINVAHLFMLISYIVRTQKQVINLQRSQSFQQAHVYVRLTIITGLFWVTGIIGSVLKSEILNDIFIFLCCLQGFFIAVSCLSTRSVLSFIRRMISVSTSESFQKEISKTPISITDS